MATSAPTVVKHFYHLETQRPRLLSYPILTAGPLDGINIAPYLKAAFGRLGGFRFDNASAVEENRIYWDIPNPSDCQLRLGLHFRKSAAVPPGFQFLIDEKGSDLLCHFIRSESHPQELAPCFSLEFGYDPALLPE